VPRSDGFDGCSCNKGRPDAWGNFGWHWFEMSADRFVSDFMRRELAVRGHRDVSQFEREQLRRTAEAQARHYDGQHYAYEPCPQYQEAARRKREQGKREEAAQRTRGGMRVV